MLIECDSCTGRGRRCPDCVVTILGVRPTETGATDATVRFDRAERQAIDVLAWAGLLPAIDGRPAAGPRERAAACLVSQSDRGVTERRTRSAAGIRKAG